MDTQITWTDKSRTHRVGAFKACGEDFTFRMDLEVTRYKRHAHRSWNWEIKDSNGGTPDSGQFAPSTPVAKAAARVSRFAELKNDERRKVPIRKLSFVKSVERRIPGLYRVTLANGAEAKVSRDNAVSGDTGSGKWQWDDASGGVPDHKTKAAAVRSFREYRG